MAKEIGLSLLDKKLLDAASNGYTPDQMEAEFFIPAAQAKARVSELLASVDIWDEVEQRRMLVYSMRRVKQQIEEYGIEADNPKHIEAYAKLIQAIDKLQSKTAAISDAELEKIAAAQGRQIVRLVEAAFYHARERLIELYPDVDLGQIDTAFWEGMSEVAGEIEA